MIGGNDDLIQGNKIGTDLAGTSSLGNASWGLTVRGSNETIGGLAAGAGNLISGNGTGGLFLDGAEDTLVSGNLIGTDVTGNKALANAVGVKIAASYSAAATGNTIGGLTAAERNIISGNTGDGMDLVGSANVIEGNYIGTNLQGEQALGNAGNGIMVGGSGDTVGGTAANAGNLISANTLAGVSIVGGVSLMSNLIGTDAGGSEALGNGIGVQISGGGNVIGNVISGNLKDGVDIASATHNNFAGESLIAGNLIGTTSDGGTPLGNGQAGVTLAIGAFANTIGGTAKGEGNVISGNGGDGIDIAGDIVATSPVGDDNYIQANLIGTDKLGAMPMGNAGNGISINGGSSNNYIGGLDADGKNIISGNGGDGIAISGAGTSANLVAFNDIGTDATGNAAMANAGNGISISAGATGNTIGASVSGKTVIGGGNVISGNQLVGVSITDTGTSGNTVAGNLIGTDASGAKALGNASGVSIINGASNNTIGGKIEDTRNVIAASTSINGYGVFINNSTDDLVSGNDIGIAEDGVTALGNRSDGVYLLNSSAITIGGTTESSANTISANGDDGIDIDGGGTNVVAANLVGTTSDGTTALGNTLSGLWIGTGSHDNTIGGVTATAANVISGNSGDGVHIEDAATTANVVEGNKIGTDEPGDKAVANEQNGIFIGDGSTNNTIGGTAAGAGNVISGNTLVGVLVSDNGTTGNLIAGNQIGTDESGTHALGNASGINIVSQAASNTIGGTVDAAANVISASSSTSSGYGVLISNATDNLLEGNKIGTAINGSDALGNLADGVDLDEASANTIGGTAAGAANVISANSGNGIDVDHSDSTLVVGNLIGVTEDGSSALGNAQSGVAIVDVASKNTVGGLTVAALNIISGNSGDGILVSGIGTTQNLIEGNYLGTDRNGIVAVANGGNGVSIADGALVPWSAAPT